MIKYKKVENDASFIRDMQNSAIINVDNQALQAYRVKRNASKKLVNDVEALKSEMAEIKTLLHELINK